MSVDNIVLIGFMGTGKTSCGKILAQRLHWEFIEMDKLIEQKAGMSVPDIFAQKGEPHFRDLETQVCRTLAKKHHTVISAGGGVVIRVENVQTLRSFAYLVLLTASPEEIYCRIIQEGKEKRPLLAKPDPMQEIKRLLAIREPLYFNAANTKIDTSGKRSETVASEIFELLSTHVGIT
jgi:shikimate kinase